MGLVRTFKLTPEIWIGLFLNFDVCILGGGLEHCLRLNSLLKMYLKRVTRFHSSLLSGTSLMNCCLKRGGERIHFTVDFDAVEIVDNTKNTDKEVMNRTLKYHMFWLWSFFSIFLFVHFIFRRCMVNVFMLGAFCVWEYSISAISV